MVKKLLSFAGAVLAVLASAAPFTLAENGKTAYRIVVPDQPAGFEQQAADDLKTYLGKMTGADFPVVPESKASGDKLIYIGKTAFAASHKIDSDRLSAEEWAIRPSGNNLILAGGYPIGSFYAVWRLLNRLGCYSLTWDQDAVPSCRKLSVDLEPETKKPAFAGRLIWDNFPVYLKKTKADPSILAAYRLYKLRNGINGRQLSDDSLWLYSAHNISHIPQFHSLSHYVNPKLFDRHPEYFAMDARGKRCKPRSFTAEGCICMSNPEVVRITLDSLRKMIRKDRAKLPRDKWPQVYDISTLDSSPDLCKCPACAEIIREEGSQTGLLMRFINQVAGEIRKEYPEIIIRTFGYSASATPPTKTLPADYVLIQLTDKFTVSDPFRPLSHPLNADRLEYFREWRKAAKRLMVWDYWNLAGSGRYFNPPRPDTVVNAIQSDLKFFRSLNVTDLFLECSRCPYAPQSFIDLTFFLGAQLMMDPDQDQERLTDIYFKYYYGPAAAEMRKIFEMIKTGVFKQKNRQTTAIVSHWTYLTQETICRTYLTLKKLSAGLPEKSVYRSRIDDERIVFVWYALSKREANRKLFRENGVDIDSLAGECQALVNAHIRRYPCKNPAWVEKRFRELFSSVELNLPRPEKFKDVSAENFRMIAYPHFFPIRKLGSAVVDDPDSVTGKAVRSANPDPAYHGVNKILPGGHGFRTTLFSWGNHKAAGKVRLTLDKVPQDEKYHWYRLPGKLELKPRSYFWGHGWAIQANTSHLFLPTDGNPLDNTWTELWFSAKFTGPAYVKGSKRENAIWVDMAVLVRGREK